MYGLKQMHVCVQAGLRIRVPLLHLKHVCNSATIYYNRVIKSIGLESVTCV